MKLFSSREKKLLRIDTAILILWPLAAAVFTLLFRAPFFVSSLLFFAVPSVWFAFRTRKAVKKTLIFACITTVIMFFVLDYLAMVNQAWSVPTIFHFSFLGILTFEDFALGFSLVFNVVIVYEHFLNHGKHELIDRRMKYFIWPFVILFLSMLVALLINDEFLQIPYFYFIAGVVLTAVPVILTASAFPKLLAKYVKIGSYFALVLLLFELIGLNLGHWSFPGSTYIGWLEINTYRFPLEEFIFWVMLTSVAIVSYYEFFDDDQK
jgi:hypothetical protein